jgi:hypothetical protein
VEHHSNQMAFLEAVMVLQEATSWCKVRADYFQRSWAIQRNLLCCPRLWCHSAVEVACSGQDHLGMSPFVVQATLWHSFSQHCWWSACANGPPTVLRVGLPASSSESISQLRWGLFSNEDTLRLPAPPGIFAKLVTKYVATSCNLKSTQSRHERDTIILH